MFSRSTLLHLRFPFSFFLLPVYLFALGVSPNFTESQLLWSFVIIHLLLYPASNGYNSYFDKDEQSIGGLKNPPPVKKGLYLTSLLMDALAVLLGAIYINKEFAIMLLVYGLVSKAYSHPAVRLKKYPIAGWLTVVLFQGLFAFMMCYIGINAFEFGSLLQPKVFAASLLATLILFGSYPMTQIYQHDEDARRGDRTMSLKLGIRGTFLFAMIFFTVAAFGFALFFSRYFEIRFAVEFMLSQLPVVIFFLTWFYLSMKDKRWVNYKMTMWLNFISATCLTGFFIYFFMATSHIGQL